MSHYILFWSDLVCIYLVLTAMKVKEKQITRLSAFGFFRPFLTTMILTAPIPETDTLSPSVSGIILLL